MYCSVLYCTVLCLALLSFAPSSLLGLTLPCLLGKKCCSPDECYDLCPPWAPTATRPVLPPTCTKTPVKYLLSNRSNPEYPVVFSTTNISQIAGYYNASKPTVIVFHGHYQSEDTPEMRNITGVYLEKVDANAIFIDSSNVTSNINYYQSVSDIRVAARYVIIAVKLLIKLGTSPSAIHLIGHSLGAHLAAYVAKGIPGTEWLTVLDPAGPAFTGEDCRVRFCESDAVFTEAVHTNGHPLIGYGTPDADADINFWVNGGWDQPGCPLAVYVLSPVGTILDYLNQTVLDNNTCSHIRSVYLYNEAVAGNCIVWGVAANETELSKSRDEDECPTENIVNTTGCTLANCVPIGLESIYATGSGDFIVSTNCDSPFCVSQS